MMMRNAMVLGCLALALAACKADEKKAVGGNASGEILPGSVSDAMLPLDTVTSQAPLAPKVDTSEKADTAKPGRQAAGPAPKPSASATEQPDEPPAAEE
jgi:hypothetical protein